ncbi:hypothetical protein ACOI1H_24910 [Loktanella sp. DJP18]|uniref:hypothetical protein n=1 Tax=Loktanella sp. DJP18 TaxID=3409788 RepID=UPI003BB6F918
MENTSPLNSLTDKDEKMAAKSATEEAKESAKTMMQSAKVAVSDQVDAAKDTAANEVDGIASALRKAADELRDDSPQSRTFRQLSTGLADFSDTIRGKDFSELTRDVSAFARRNPVVFLGGAVLIGLAASRFAKASEHASHDDRDSAERRFSHSPYATPADEKPQAKPDTSAYASGSTGAYTKGGPV